MARVRVGRRIAAVNVPIVVDVWGTRTRPPAPALIVSGGNFQTEIDHLELGRRAATMLDSESCWGADGMVFWHYVDLHHLERQTGRNPISKEKPTHWRDPRAGNGFWMVTDAWVATCPDCEWTQRRCTTRKVAKDAFYRHRREDHAGHGGP